MLPPILRAQQAAIAAGATEERFISALRTYLVHGYVLGTPEAFVAMHATRHDLPVEELLDPTLMVEEPDTWFVHCAGGQLDSAFLLVPYSLPLLCFHRSRRGHRALLSFHRFDRFRHHALRVGAKFQNNEV